MTYDLRDDYLAEGYGEEETAEFDHPLTIAAIEDALRNLGYETDRIGHIRALAKRLVAGERWDLVFNIAEGLRGFGREAQVPALLDAWDIPYTFSDPLVLSLTLHKGMTKAGDPRPRDPDAGFRRRRNAGGDRGRGVCPFRSSPNRSRKGRGKGSPPPRRSRTGRNLKRVCRRFWKPSVSPSSSRPFSPGGSSPSGSSGPARRRSPRG